MLRRLSSLDLKEDRMLVRLDELSRHLERLESTATVNSPGMTSSFLLLSLLSLQPRVKSTRPRTTVLTRLVINGKVVLDILIASHE